VYRYLGSDYEEPQYQTMGSSNNGYGPLNFKYSTPDTSFATSVSPTYLRNDFAGFLGMKITVGGSAIVVDQLGRYFISGNNRLHTLKIVNAANNTDLISTTIDLGQGSVDNWGFKYAPLPYAVTLQANTSYYVVSSENTDQWYNGDTTVNNTAIAAINNAVYQSGSSYVGVAGTNHGYGPVNFKYAVNTQSFITGSSLTTSADNTKNGFAGMQITTAGHYLFVNELGRYYIQGNTRVHTLKIVNAQSGADVAVATIDMSQGSTDQNGFKYAALPTSVILAPNTSYDVVSSEVANGDQWLTAACTESYLASAATLTNAVYIDPNGVVSAAGGQGNAYGPVNFKF
jgi:hypothetical protein